jgi:ubiquinone/menaquinone biosynthesis C-methylase UbiE
MIDIGCGNGRNSKYLKQLGMHVMSLDGKGDYGIQWIAGSQIPTESNSAAAILCNYFLMFIEQRTRNDIYTEIDRVSRKGTRLMVELEKVKQSLTPTECTLNALNEEVQDSMQQLGWKILKQHKNRYIFEKTT